MPNYDFCRVHGFGRLKGTPWYQNGIFLAVVTSIVGFLIAHYYFVKGPSLENQDEILAKQVKSMDMQDETLAILRRMAAFQKENDPALRAKFNLGYILFSAIERKQIVPLNSPLDEVLKIDWASGYDVSFSVSNVTLRLPNMTIQPPNSGRIEVRGSRVVLEPV